MDAALLPPGGPLDVVFTFDTTGSMYSCLAEVRKKIAEIITRLFKDIPALRIAVLAHGDYCDKGTYVTKYVDFTNDPDKLCKFVKNVQATGGGDFEECYELVLRQVREVLSWGPGTQRSIVMVGDAIPHPKDDPQNTLKIDWEVETKKIYAELGAKIYAVQANESAVANSFWNDLAALTNGKRLNLKKFNTIIDMLMAICYRERGPEYFLTYEKEVRAREGRGIRPELNSMFDVLRDGDAPSACDSSPPSPSSSSDEAADVTTLPKGKVRGKRPRGHDVSTKVSAGKRSKVTMAARKTVSMKRTSSRRKSRRLLAKAAKLTGDEHIKYMLGRERRETVAEAGFSFVDLDWTSWKQAMIPMEPAAGASAELWVPRRGDLTGVRNQGLFAGETSTPALYEFAVQVKAKGRRYPVYCRAAKGFNHGCWDTYLLRKRSRINGQIDEVLKKGCKLFVRRAPMQPGVTAHNGGVLDSVKELDQLVKQQYDYAWNAKGTGRPRSLLKCGVPISSATL